MHGRFSNLLRFGLVTIVHKSKESVFIYQLTYIVRQLPKKKIRVVLYKKQYIYVTHLKTLRLHKP